MEKILIHRLRLAVHAADRPPRPRAERLLRNPPLQHNLPAIDASVRGVILSGSPFSVRDARSPAAPTFRPSRAGCRCWASATARSTSPRHFGGEVHARARAANTAGRCSPWATPRRRGSWRGLPRTARRCGCRTATPSPACPTATASWLRRHRGRARRRLPRRGRADVGHPVPPGGLPLDRRRAAAPELRRGHLRLRAVVDLGGFRRGYRARTAREARATTRSCWRFRAAWTPSVAGRAAAPAPSARTCYCVFVDSGLLRKNEFGSVLESYKRMGLNVKGVKASATSSWATWPGVTDPEAEAQDHRPRLRGGLQRRGAVSSPTSSGWRRARSIPTSIESCIGQRPCGHDQVAPQRRRAARAHAPEESSSRCACSSRTRCAAWAARWASPSS